MINFDEKVAENKTIHASFIRTPFVLFCLFLSFVLFVFFVLFCFLSEPQFSYLNAIN